VAATDYALRIRNDWHQTVTVTPWSDASSTDVLPGGDVVISTRSHPKAPWTITLSANNATIWSRMLRGTQDETGPGNPSFPKVYSYFIDLYPDGTIITCPGGCGAT
jgi:hypothetical protein